MVDLPVRPPTVGRQHQEAVVRFRSDAVEREVLMVWGYIRIALFSGSFLAGLFFFGPGPMPVQSKPVQRMDFSSGKTHKIQKSFVTHVVLNRGGREQATKNT